MEETKSTRRFFGYPKPVEAPVTPFTKSDDANPVFSGILLVIGAWLVSKLQFVQRFLWANAGFNGLRDLQHLKDYTERWDPTVIPLPSEPEAPTRLDSESFPMHPGKDTSPYHSISEYHMLYLSGELTPLAVAVSLLPLIQRDAKIKSHHSTAFIDSHAEAILEAARASTERYKAGTPLSILDGVPTAIKDESDVAGYRTTQGRAKNDAAFKIQTKSTWPVQKLQEAGMINLGKLNMHELGADTTNNNPNWGTPLNPYNPHYYTGGSSGGPAYVVSAGLAPVVMGSDGGGSIRIPASFCGIYGLKPSHGRLEDTGSTVTVTGPLAATMSDLEAFYRVIAVPNPSDPICALFSPPIPRPLSHQSKIIGVYKDWFARADRLVLETCTDVISHYKDVLGYEIVDIKLPYCPEGQLAHAMTILSEMAARARENPTNAPHWLSTLNPANKVLLAVGEQTPGRDYLLAQQLRQMLMQHLAFLYQRYPGLIIVTPTSPIAGWAIKSEKDLKHGFTDGNQSIRNMEYVWLANFCGNPAISCPAGYVEPDRGGSKIPVGIMAMGEWGAEDQLIQWGKECEAYLNGSYPGGRVQPGNWEDVVGNAKTSVLDLPLSSS